MSFRRWSNASSCCRKPVSGMVLDHETIRVFSMGPMLHARRTPVLIVTMRLSDGDHHLSPALQAACAIQHVRVIANGRTVFSKPNPKPGTDGEANHWCARALRRPPSTTTSPNLPSSPSLSPSQSPRIHSNPPHASGDGTVEMEIAIAMAHDPDDRRLALLPAAWTDLTVEVRSVNDRVTDVRLLDRIEVIDDPPRPPTPSPRSPTQSPSAVQSASSISTPSVFWATAAELEHLDNLRIIPLQPVPKEPVLEHRFATELTCGVRAGTDFVRGVIIAFAGEARLTSAWIQNGAHFVVALFRAEPRQIRPLNAERSVYFVEVGNFAEFDGDDVAPDFRTGRLRIRTGEPAVQLRRAWVVYNCSRAYSRGRMQLQCWGGKSGEVELYTRKKIKFVFPSLVRSCSSCWRSVSSFPSPSARRPCTSSSLPIRPRGTDAGKA